MNSTASQVGAKADEIDRKSQEFFDTANNVLSWVPDAFSHLIEPIKKGLEYVRQKLQEFWNDMKRLLVTQHGEPDTLKQTGDDWVNRVGHVAHAVSGDIQLEKLKTWQEWEGKAAEAYKVIIPPQSEGLKGIKAVAEQLRTSLTSLANAIESFWTMMLIGLGAFVVTIFFCCLEAAGIVTLPAAIPTFGTGATAAIGLISLAVGQTMAIVDTIEAEQTGIRQKIHDLGSEWTKSSANLSDATTSDGDPSDWQVDT